MAGQIIMTETPRSITMTKQSLAKILTYAGILPFLVCAVLALFTDDAPLLPVGLSQVVLAYGAVIASFVAGIHWGIFLFRDTPVNLFIHSNVIALLAWLSLLMPTAAGTCTLIICFGYLLFIDNKNHHAKAIESWFFTLRIQASVAVIITLIVFLLSRLV